MRIFTLLKAVAQQLGLFEETVEVKGHARKDGTYVKPHQAKRKKKAKPPPAKHQKRDAVVQDLFAAISRDLLLDNQEPVKKEKPAKSTFKPTHKLSDGTLVKKNDDDDAQPDEWLDAEGTIIEDEYAVPLSTEKKKKSAKWRTPKAKAKTTKKPPTDTESVIDKSVFGVPAGIGKAERIRLNEQAIALLNSRDGDFSEEDKAVLRQYSGQGGVGDSLNEFYTRPDVAIAMWDVLARLGIDEGRVLEPSAGTGVYLHTAPDGFKVTGIELDKTSAGIAKVLHGGKHEIVHSALEGFATTDPRQFDAVIGNVPFGLRGALIKQDKSKLKTAEQYFVDTSIDKVRDGGVVALIVPTGIMDNRSTRAFRERILRKAEFLGAHRMPNSAFEHSHTGVTTDIVIFRKRPTDVGQALGTVDKDVLEYLMIWDEEFISGKYFSGRGKDQVYGSPEAGWRSKAGMGNDFTVIGNMAGVADNISAWDPGKKLSPSKLSMAVILDALDGLGKGQKAIDKAVSAALKSPYEVARLGDTKTVDGILYVLQGEPPRWHRADGEIEEHASVTQGRELAQHIEALAEGRFETDKGRQDAVKLLDAYIKKHGNPATNKELQRAAKDDPVLWRLIASTDRFGAYSDLLTGQKLKTESSFDAVAAGILADQDSFTENEIAENWAGGDQDAALDHLFASQNYALDADGERWTTMDEYLSGELWPKYDALQDELKKSDLADGIRDKFELQSKALMDAIDPRLLDDVEIKVNSGWIPTEVVAAYFNSRVADYKAENSRASHIPDDMTITYASGYFKVEGGLWSDTELLEKYLNRNGVRKDTLPTIDKWNLEFREWLTGSEHREAMEDLYNRKFHGFRQKTYSDAPMDVPGLNPALDVNAYHFEGLRWALDQGKGIIAADVGLGKTGRALMLAKLAKSSGQSKKPMIVVPKSVLANWVEEAEFWFPGSRVLTIGETVTEDRDGNLKSRSDTKADRDRKYHELAQNDYDFILISQPAWNDLDLDPIEKKELSDQDFWNQRGDAMDKAGNKRRTKIREAYKQALAERDFKTRTNAIYFNDLGVDMIIGDEFHAYKNLYAVRNRFGESPKFLGGGGLSNRAQDTFFKSQWLRDNNGGKGVYGLTATPTKNSPLEIYSMLSHIAPEAFENIGIRNSEEFLDRFCEFATENILTTSGQIEEALVTTGFKNLNELRDIMRRYIDRKTAEDVGLQLPTRNDHQHLIDMTDEQEAVYQDLRAMAEGDTEDNAHIFSIMDKMGKASIDLELLGDEHQGAKSPKVDACAKKVVKGLKDGGQVVFTDHLSVHDKLKAALIKQGLKPDEIAVVNAQVAKTSMQRQKIANQFNAGKIKVVIGNTATMGEGMNLQKTTTDIHHLDLPWEPASMQQRNGRGLRQGNKNESIRIHTYLAKGSFDGYRYQTMMAKKDWQDLLWNGGDRVENLAREGSFSRDEMMIMLAANPDEARKQYENNKAVALERQAAAKRGKAAEAFVKFQEVKTSLSRLKDKGSKSAQRLAGRVDKLRERLKADKHFLAKESLDLDKPVLLQKDTGTAYHEGMAFEMDAGKDTPIHWSDTEKSRWVVTEVTRNKVEARPYGKLEGDGTHTFDIDKMHRGVAPIKDYTADKENQDIAAAKRSKEIKDIVSSGMSGSGGSGKASDVSNKMLAAAEKAVTEGRGAHEWWSKEQTRATMRVKILDALHETAPESMADDDFKDMVQSVYVGALFADAGIPAGLDNPENLKHVSSGVQKMFNREIQAHLKDKVRDYRDRWSGPYGMIDSDGKLVAFQSFHGRKKVDDHDLILPTKENREKMLRAWVNMEQSRKIGTHYIKTGRRNSAGLGAPSGIKTSYPDWEYGNDTGNPWTTIGNKLYGHEFETDARKMLQDSAEHTIKYASDFGEAVTAATHTLSADYGGTPKWSKGALKALWGRAAKDKLLSSTIGEMLPEGAHKDLLRYKVNNGYQSENAASLSVQDAIIKLANSSGHKDLAAAVLVQGAKHSKESPGRTLQDLEALRVTRSNGQPYPSHKMTYHLPSDVLDAMQAVADEHGVGGTPVRKVMSTMNIPMSAPFYKNSDMTLNEAIAEARKEAA